MPEGNVVRTPLSVPAEGRQTRSLDERLLVRLPALLPIITAAVMRLSPRSRARRALLALGVRRAWAASNRGDLELLLRGYHPEVEIRWPEEGALHFPDLSGTYHGHQGFRQVWRALHEPWEVDTQLHELIDAGNHLVVIGEQSLRGKGSGVRASAPLIQVVTFRSGRIVREEWFDSREAAFEAAGIIGVAQK